MHLTHITYLLLFLLASHRALADDDSSTEANEIIPREAIQKLDFSVRQALLRAIDKLEEEARDDDDSENHGTDNELESTTILPASITIQSTTATPFTTKEEILEESTSPSDIFPSVQFFTATFDENNPQEQPLTAFINKSKKIIHKSVNSPVIVSTNVEEETKNYNQADRGVNNNVKTNEISLNSLDEIKFEISNLKTNQKPTTTTKAHSTTTTTKPWPRTTRKRITTTSTSTTTTTPRPTHNEDGENIEIVDKDDIRIQAAPLVSAFTVDLDELGTAKKVIPIIDNSASTTAVTTSSTQRTSPIFQPPLFEPTITKLNVLDTNEQRSVDQLNLMNNLPIPTKATFSTSTINILSTPGHYITKQPPTTNLYQQQAQQQDNNVNNYLVEKQRELEQQIYQLKLQAQRQQELILRQLKLLEEQAKQKNSRNDNENPENANNLSLIQSSNNLLQTHFTQQQQHQPQQLPVVQQQESGFTIRPSVQFIPSKQTEIVPILPAFHLNQQLPLKKSNGKYINGIHQQQQVQSNEFANNILQPQNQQQQLQQRLPIDNNPIRQVFKKLQNLESSLKSNTQAASSISSIQIQPSNQLNIVPTIASLLSETPAELSLVQALPQRNYQQFQKNPFVPQYVTNALFERQQQQNQARFFRQESDTTNPGINQVQTQPNNNIFSPYHEQQQQSTNNFNNQNFYRQQLIPAFNNQLQQNAQTFYHQQQYQQNSPTGNVVYNQRFHNNLNNNLDEFNIINKVLALNHGINNFVQQTLLPPTQDSAPTDTLPLLQSARFNNNIF